MLKRLCALVVLVGGCSSPPPDPQQGTMALPVPENGYQIPFGPFEVPPGKEIQLCRTLKLPNDAAMAFNRVQVSMPPGSHHYIIFRSTKDFPDQVFPCWGTVNFEDWEFVADVNRTGGFDWTLGDGQAFVFDPHQQIMLQSHYVNATTVQSPEGAMNYLNLYSVPTEQVKHTVRGMFTVNTRVSIPPHSEYSTTRNCTLSHNVFVVDMTGHFHARGTSFIVDRSQQAVPLEQIYRSDSWDSPEFKIFQAPMQMLGNSFQGVQFTCKYYNDTDMTIGFGSHADVQEHCNLFFHYYDAVEPTADRPYQTLTCAEGQGGW